MKKLMIAASAVLCATVGFSDVTSANIVGYHNYTLKEGNQFTGAKFVALQDGTFNDLKVSGYGDAYYSGGIYISKFDIYGGNLGNAYWWDVDEFHGWYNDGDDPSGADPVGETEYAAGEGLIVGAQPEDVGLQLVSAGQVDMDGVAITLADGNQYLNCAVPRDCVSGEIKIDGYGDDYYSGGIYISRFDIYGGNLGNVYWWDVDGFYGWYTDGDDPSGGEEANDIELEAGEGLIVGAQPDDVGLQIIMPPAIPVEEK